MKIIRSKTGEYAATGMHLGIAYCEIGFDRMDAIRLALCRIHTIHVTQERKNAARF